MHISRPKCVHWIFDIYLRKFVSNKSCNDMRILCVFWYAHFTRVNSHEMWVNNSYVTCITERVFYEMRINCLTKLQAIDTHKCVFMTRVLRKWNTYFGQLGYINIVSDCDALPFWHYSNFPIVQVDWCNLTFDKTFTLAHNEQMDAEGTIYMSYQWQWVCGS